MKLKARNLRVIKSAEIEIDRTLLYGPNASGKSTLIQALLMFLTVGIEPLSGEEINLSKDSEVEIIHNGTSCKNFLDRECLKSFWNNLGIRNVEYVRGDAMMVFSPISREPTVVFSPDGKYKVEVKITNIDSLEEWKALTIYPNIIYMKVGEESLRSLIAETLGFRGVQSGYVNYMDEWRPINKLSYGYKRALMMIFALAFSDLLIIENFDSGLHVGLALKLLNLIKRRMSLIETHNGGLAVILSERGWNSYYLNNGIAKKIDFSSAEAFKEEKSIYYA